MDGMEAHVVIELFFKIDHQSIGNVSLREISTKSVINFQVNSGKIWKFGVMFCGVRACFGLNRVAQTAELPFLT